MHNKEGFSLLEVLISLLLITGTTLAILHKHWQLSQTTNHILNDAQALLKDENDHEKKRLG